MTGSGVRIPLAAPANQLKYIENFRARSPKFKHNRWNHRVTTARAVWRRTIDRTICLINARETLKTLKGLTLTISFAKLGHQILNASLSIRSSDVPSGSMPPKIAFNFHLLSFKAVYAKN
jgi:hypothetical protein